MVHIDSTGKTDIIENERYLHSVTYSGSVSWRGEKEVIVTFANLVFHIKDQDCKKIAKLIAQEELPNATPRDAQTVQFGEKTYLFFPRSYGDHAEENGFIVGEVDSSGNWSTLAHYIAGKSWKYFQECVMHQSGENLIVHGDGYYYLLKLKQRHIPQCHEFAVCK